MIKNLNQLRRTLREGTQLEILDHCRPECIGQIRNITLVNTQGFYSTVANQPDASANRGNGGRGPILWWGRAAHWQFADGVCSVFDSEQKHTEEELVMPEYDGWCGEPAVHRSWCCPGQGSQNFLFGCLLHGAVWCAADAGDAV